MGRLEHSTEQEEIMAYLDGELSAEQAAKAAAHLQDCHSCQQFAADLRGVSQEMTNWEVEPFARELDGRLLAGLNKREQARTGQADARPSVWLGILHISRWPRWRWVTAAAGIAVLLVGGELMRVRYAAPGLASRALIGAEKNQARIPTQEELRRMQEAPFASSLAVDKSHAGGVVGGVQRYVPSPTEAGPAKQEGSPAANAPMIARTAELAITTKDFEAARVQVDDILRRHGGYVGEMSVSSPSDAEHKLSAMLRIPAEHLEAAIAELKKVGRVESESQSGEEVTSQYIDLQARLTNSRNTEQRLTELLRTKTGKLEEVVEVEQKLSEVREEIERMEAEKKALTKRVDFATLNLSLTEEHRAQLQMVPPSVGTQFRNAGIAGYRSVVESIVNVLLFLMSWGPSLLLWGAIVILPVRYVWRRMHANTAPMGN
jgi:anti-sigma factor RsiW